MNAGLEETFDLHLGYLSESIAFLMFVS
jgi:hypothetical protein